ncbi:MAG: hypothetical protein GXO00_01490 [Candidatus Diapherotrites archaeon]|nr:hypothetical protein [Candidatus Diapherotrites archaeon]
MRRYIESIREKVSRLFNKSERREKLLARLREHGVPVKELSLSDEEVEEFHKTLDTLEKKGFTLRDVLKFFKKDPEEIIESSRPVLELIERFLARKERKLRVVPPVAPYGTEAMESLKFISSTRDPDTLMRWRNFIERLREGDPKAREAVLKYQEELEKKLSELHERGELQLETDEKGRKYVPLDAVEAIKHLEKGEVEKAPEAILQKKEISLGELVEHLGLKEHFKRYAQEIGAREDEKIEVYVNKRGELRVSPEIKDLAREIRKINIEKVEEPELKKLHEENLKGALMILVGRAREGTISPYMKLPVEEKR